MKTEDLTLSITHNGYALIYQGLPLCNDKQTLDEIFLVAKMYKCDMPTIAWNGITGNKENVQVLLCILPVAVRECRDDRLVLCNRVLLLGL